MYKFLARVMGVLIAVAAALGVMTVSANAQASAERSNGGLAAQASPVSGVLTAVRAPKDCSLPSFYINGSNVRIRKLPGGVVQGFAQYGERIDVSNYSGSWVYVWFKNRGPGQVGKGWVHQDYVDYRNPPPCR